MILHALAQLAWLVHDRTSRSLPVDLLPHSSVSRALEQCASRGARGCSRRGSQVATLMPPASAGSGAHSGAGRPAWGLGEMWPIATLAAQPARPTSCEPCDCHSSLLPQHTTFHGRPCERAHAWVVPLRLQVASVTCCVCMSHWLLPPESCCTVAVHFLVLECKVLFSSQDSPSHRILRHIHETLNIDENKN